MLGSCCLKVLVKITTQRSHPGKQRAEICLSKISLVCPPPLCLLFIPPTVPWLLLVSMFPHFPSLVRVSAAPPRKVILTLSELFTAGASSVRIFHLELGLQKRAGQKNSSSLHKSLNYISSQGAGSYLLPDPKGSVRVKILGGYQVCVDQLKIRAHPNFSV